jgi:hypothetical protein
LVGRWDKATPHRSSDALRDRLGIAVSRQRSEVSGDLLDSGQWQWLEGQGIRQLRADTGTKDPRAPKALPTPGTICCV